MKILFWKCYKKIITWSFQSARRSGDLVRYWRSARWSSLVRLLSLPCLAQWNCPLQAFSNRMAWISANTKKCWIFMVKWLSNLYQLNFAGDILWAWNVACNWYMSRFQKYKNVLWWLSCCYYTSRNHELINHCIKLKGKPVKELYISYITKKEDIFFRPLSIIQFDIFKHCGEISKKVQI